MKNIIKIYLKYAAPFWLVFFTVMVIYGSIKPWPPAEQLFSEHENEIILLTGFEERTKGNYSFSSRSYTIINFENKSSSSVTIFKDTDGLNKTLKTDGGLISLILCYFIAISLTWYFWLSKSHITKRLTRTAATQPLG